MILIVDDNESVRGFLGAYAELRHYEVVMASSGEEGLRLFKEKAPDIVITDRSRPGDSMQGDALVEEIRKISPLTPIIVLSTNRFNLPSGVVFLQKPASIVELDAAIAKAISGD
ncbi:MAG: response regulator [Patescibacteria group bacterium]